MPTPVSTAKQCLTAEASLALDEAVAVARGRHHPQTTSLHAVSALLSRTPSQLKQACIRARNAAFYNPKVQLKALEFCLCVSLDRLPVSQNSANEPVVSNSLMAAIKRSQANQRRHPDCVVAIGSDHGLKTGHFRDQNFEGGLSSSLTIKVDLKHLIASILDDPIVSRVFSDAGFSSLDVKMAVLRPFQGFYRYPDTAFSRVRGPVFGSWDVEGEYRRVLEVLRKVKGRNPLLVGVCAYEVLKGFVEVLERKREGLLPIDLYGINVVSVEEELARFVTDKLSYEAIELRFKEVVLMVEQCIGPGLVVNVGNVKRLLEKDDGGEMNGNGVVCVVKKLAKLVEIHGGRVWIIGSAANDQTYMEFLSKFPSVDKDWDLQPLPVTSIKASVGDSGFKSSLMRSFVPFGGFFSTPPDPKGTFNYSYQSDTRCTGFNGKLLKDVTALPKKVVMASVADLGVDCTLDQLKAKRGATIPSGTVTDLQRNSGDVSLLMNRNLPSTHPDSFQPPTNVVPHCAELKLTTLDNENGCIAASSVNPCTFTDVREQLTSELRNQISVGSLIKDNFLAKLSGSPSKTKSQHPHVLCISGVDEGQTFPSGAPVLTELGLDLFSRVSKQKKSNADADDFCHLAKFSNYSSFNFSGQAANNFKEFFKSLFERVGRQTDALGVVSQIVSQSWISNGPQQRGGLRGNVWLNFIGPDMFGKRKTALALAEILYGSKKYFIHVNLCSKNVVVQPKKVFGYQILNGSDPRCRGKTIVDHIAEELRNTPFSVVLLENAHFADPVAQSSLLQAIRTGKFSDSYGREVSLTNRVFVLTSRSSPMEKPPEFIEARMERAKDWPLQLVIKSDGDYKNHQNSFILGPEKNTRNQIFLCKRKLNNTVDQVKRPHKGRSMSLDLNLPAEVTEENEANFEDTDHGCMVWDSVWQSSNTLKLAPRTESNTELCDTDLNRGYESKNALSWLDELSDEVVDKTLVKVVFAPFDYDALVTKLLKLVHSTFYKVIDSKCLFEIEPRAMDQIIAAACSSHAEKDVEDWIEQVLSISFCEAQKTYQLTSHSVVMLATCEGEELCTDDQVMRVYLPSKVGVS
ncbi:hypothetical protein vseg_006669 [Gypsophila vaccaria]